MPTFPSMHLEGSVRASSNPQSHSLTVRVEDNNSLPLSLSARVSTLLFFQFIVFIMSRYFN